MNTPTNSEASPLAAGSQAWQDPGMIIQFGATYREKSTGRVMELDGASMSDNELNLRPAGAEWAGTSQAFAAEFEFVAPWSPENETRPLDTTPCSAVRLLYKAAVSGLWYANHGAAGSINAIWVNGNVQSAPTCAKCQEETELEEDEWKCPQCGWTKESTLPNA